MPRVPRRRRVELNRQGDFAEAQRILLSVAGKIQACRTQSALRRAVKDLQRAASETSAPESDGDEGDAFRSRGVAAIAGR